MVKSMKEYLSFHASEIIVEAKDQMLVNLFNKEKSNRTITKIHKILILAKLYTPRVKALPN
ncbi:41454_t:CDS:2 [Gigaspora margarita]|uniref:41454_t:CDS:1 n=1 Tax=Gigaspora margarita TaxID=4874 RepID=A0ABM8VVP8_GIGMA|nr:41454_t:CDS:2 [Gigaspora margarita]